VTEQPRQARSRWPAGAAAVAAVVVAAAGCGRNPFLFEWNDTPDTVLLFSLARPELNLESGFAFRQRVRIRVESAVATGTWDVAVDTRGGELVLLPPGALGVISQARITTFEGMALADVLEAPRDTAVYVSDRAVPLRMGTVYVVKTNREPGAFGSSCVYYAKMEPVVLDVAGGTLTFRHVTNPVCNSVDLIPPR